MSSALETASTTGLLKEVCPPKPTQRASALIPDRQKEKNKSGVPQSVEEQKLCRLKGTKLKKVP
jgi:hypothetical protein